MVRGGVQPSWPEEERRRLDSAVLAISVGSLAELRDGHIYAGWSEARRARAEGLIASYPWVPLDMTTVNECARLRAACRSSGVVVPVNDIRIAAVANVRGWTLVSCDKALRLDPGRRPPVARPRYVLRLA
jgi:predicted nucleic acid-binding protein